MHQVQQKACQQQCMFGSGRNNLAIPHRSFFLGRVTKIDAVLVFIGSCLGNANNFLCVHKYNTDLEWICEACKFAAFWLL